MRKHSLPTPERLRKLLRYEPDTGLFFWRERTPEDFSEKQRSKQHRCNTWNRRYAGKVAFSANINGGYLVGSVDALQFRSHRAAWAMYYGEWPNGNIDHRNGDTSDNRIKNLRNGSQSQNSRNCRLRKDSSSGHTGVHWHKAAGKWMVHGVGDGRRVYLGLFTDLDEAVTARREFNRKNAYSDRHGTAVLDEEFDLDG